MNRRSFIKLTGSAIALFPCLTLPKSECVEIASVKLYELDGKGNASLVPNEAFAADTDWIEGTGWTIDTTSVDYYLRRVS